MNCLHVIQRRTAKQNHLKKYFTGIPCKYGHIDVRWTVNARCVSCHEASFTRVRFPMTDQEKLDAIKITKKEVYERIKADPARMELKREASRRWKKNNPEKLKQSWAEWRKKDSSKSITFMRGSLRRCLVREKNGRTEDLLGYTRHELRSHIERQFSKGMAWDNHGKWQIDHITSISTFINQGIDDPKIINALTNLKPIWAKENQLKNNKAVYLI